MPAHKVSGLVADVEMHVIKPEPLDLGINRSRHHIAGRKLHPLGIVESHEPLARARVDQVPAFAAHGLGDQEVFDIEVVEAGRVELHHLHVRNARPGPPCHCDPITRRAARGGGELVHAARAARGKDRGAGDMAFHPPSRLVERIDPPDAPGGGKLFAVTVSDQVDTGAARQQGDVGVILRRLDQRRLHRPASRIVDMDNPPVRMAAFARQVERIGIAVERHAQLAQAVDGLRRAFDHEFDRGQIVQPRASHHRIAHVVFKRVARVEHRRDPALRPGG